MQSPPGYDFLTFCFEFPNTIPSANPHGMADLRRFSVDKPCLQHFRNSIKNVERAAENRQNALQNHSWAPKNDQKEVKRTKKSNRNRKTKRKTFQGDYQTVLDHPRGRSARYYLTPAGPFGHPKRHQNGAENDPKSKRKNKRPKKRSKTISDPSWSDLGSFWGTILNEKTPKTIGKRNVS